MARSFFDFLESHADSIPERPAARIKTGGQWQDVSWRELKERADAVSAALVRFGIAPRERVAVLANTRLEWTLSDLGVVGAGAVTVPVYQSNTPEEVAYILDNAGAVMVIAEDAEQLAKVRQVRDRVENLRRIVVIDPTGVEAAEGEADFTSWDDFLEEGRGALGDGNTVQELGKRRHSIEKGDLATLIYTSGTTGKPKGVVISHENLIVAARAVEEIKIIEPDDTQLLFLPLAHSFAKLLQVGWLVTGSTLAYAESIDQLVPNMSEVRPTFMASVPRIFEKVHAKVVGGATSQPGIKGKLASWAFAEGEKAAAAEHRGESPGGLSWLLARKLVFSKVAGRLNELFGGRLRFFVSGGAPLSKEIAYFFKYAGVEICEGYGLTENNSITSFNRPGRAKLGTVGTAMPTVELKLADDGEILQHGPTVFGGYWERPEDTAEVLSDDGWFSTGDIGEFDGDGYLKITDRKKDLIVTAGGKNIAPQHIENLLKSRSPLISQVVVYGDNKPYLVGVVTLDEAAVKEWAGRHGHSGSHAELAASDAMRQAVQREVEAVNAQLPSYETLKYFEILDHDFEVGDQLTPTLKVRRKVVGQRYGDVFQELYERGEKHKSGA
jgi:long-chain acyl-CoA synthetase